MSAVGRRRALVTAIGVALVGAVGAGSYNAYAAERHEADKDITTAPVVHARLLSAQVHTSTTLRANTQSVQLINLPGFTQESVDVNGVERHYYLQTPSRTDGTAPLIIALHGLNSSPRWIAENTGLARAAQVSKVALAVPVTMNGAWNDGRLGPSGPNDQAFLLAIVQQTVAARIVDPHRVVISGFSNGAEMSLTMASRCPQAFAAVVSISGELPSAPGSARPTAPIPAYFTHGTTDKIQPITGRPPRSKLFNGLISEDATVGAFVSANHAKPPTKKFLPKGPASTAPTTQYSYAPGQNGASVTLYELPGIGHKWPAAASHTATNDGVVAAGFDATTLIVHVASTASR